MNKILLTNGDIVLVDVEDYPNLIKSTWMKHSCGYAYRKIYLGKINNKYKYKNEFMHRVIMNPSKDMVIDHINHNMLDNRKFNLRICTRGENNMNKLNVRKNISGYKGVVWNKRDNKWTAQLIINYKNKNLGNFVNIQHAWLARRWGERLYFKDFMNT